MNTICTSIRLKHISTCMSLTKRIILLNSRYKANGYNFRACPTSNRMDYMYLCSHVEGYNILQPYPLVLKYLAKKSEDILNTDL